jgi:hypothetical protein
MSEGFVMPLSGEEVIGDVLDQIAKGLRRDCNFRGSDAYSGGYEGKIMIKLTLRGIDAPQVEMEIPILPDKSVVLEDSAEYKLREVNVEQEVDIPLETDLNEVRERSGQVEPEQTLDPTAPQPENKRRKYARRAEGAAL